jgi:4-hydroxybenzoate polyprenyltransferase
MKILPYLKLVRLPNVFTALADIAVGVAFALFTLSSLSWQQSTALGLLFLASLGLYQAGMVFNDVFDRKIDAKERPFRPIPSGQVPLRSAIRIGLFLMFLGLGSALGASLLALDFTSDLAQPPLFWACLLALMTFLYNAGLKHSWLGPFAMASCRFLNMKMGFSLLADGAAEVSTPIALITSCYILGVTVFAKQEVTKSETGRLQRGTFFIILSAIGAMVFAGYTPSANSYLAPALLVTYFCWLVPKWVKAVQGRTPALVQNAVRSAILGLIVFDAILACQITTPGSLIIVLFLIPALLTGKWIYST